MYAAVIVKIMDDLLKVRELRECPAEIHLEIQAVKKPIMWKLPDLREIKEKMFVWVVVFFFKGIKICFSLYLRPLCRERGEL